MKLGVIKTGGKQYVVKEQDKLKVEKLDAKVGDKVSFDVLLTAEDDNVVMGTPTLSQKIDAIVKSHGRSVKVEGVRYKRKTRQSKRFGHRQNYTEVEITKI